MAITFKGDPKPGASRNVDNEHIVEGLAHAYKLWAWEGEHPKPDHVVAFLAKLDDLLVRDPEGLTREITAFLAKH